MTFMAMPRDCFEGAGFNEAVKVSLIELCVVLQGFQGWCLDLISAFNQSACAGFAETFDALKSQPTEWHPDQLP